MAMKRKKIEPKVLVEIKHVDESTAKAYTINAILKATDDADMEKIRIPNNSLKLKKKSHEWISIGTNKHDKDSPHNR
uniref:Uncharacterized protein n=1 Tax=Glossina pallidipes TaxID=7398 RepID=A0A1A9ZEF7_GLOPL